MRWPKLSVNDEFCAKIGKICGIIMWDILNGIFNCLQCSQFLILIILMFPNEADSCIL